MSDDELVGVWVDRVSKVLDEYNDEHSGCDGRPLVLTPVVAESIFRSLLAGSSERDACFIAGISSNRITGWRMRAKKKGDEPFKTFIDGVNVFNAYGKKCLMKIIRGHSSDDWKAAAWLLERRFPDEFGRTNRVNVNTDNELNISIKAVESPYKMSDDEKQLLEESGQVYE